MILKDYIRINLISIEVNKENLKEQNLDTKEHHKRLGQVQDFQDF